jgi:conjugal transfer pilus assembly protein TraD
VAQQRPSSSSDDTLLTLLAIAFGGLIVLVFAGVPLVLSVLFLVIGRFVGVRWWWWWLAAAALGGLVYLFGGPAALMAYPETTKAIWNAKGQMPEALEANWWPWLQAMLPTALVVAGAFAGGLELYFETARPWWKPKRAQKPFGLLGQAKIQRTKAAIQRGEAQVKDGFALGVDEVGNQVVISDHEANMHGLIVGATGAGKTTTILRMLAGVIPRGLPVAVIDLKGDPAVQDHLRRMAEQSGRVFELWTMNGPGIWNPMARGDATELKDKLVGLEEWTEPHYKRAAERYLQWVFMVLEQRGETPTLARVVDLLHGPALEELGRDRAIPNEMAQQLRAYLQGIDKTQLSGISGMQSRLGLLVEGRAGRFLGQQDGQTIDLLRSVQEGRVTLFSLDSQRYGSTAAQMGSMVLQDLKTVASELSVRQSRKMAYVIVDEFSALSGDHLLGLLNKGRSAGMCVWLSTQELADLDRVSPQFAAQVIGNTNIKVVHRQDHPDSAELLAAVAGTRSTWEETLQFRMDPGAFGGGRGEATGLGSLRKTEQFSIHPNVIKSLRTGSCVLIRKSPRLSTGTVDVASLHSVE